MPVFSMSVYEYTILTINELILLHNIFEICLNLSELLESKLGITTSFTLNKILH